MTSLFDFNAVRVQNCNSPLQSPVEIVGGYAADRDGFPIEGAKPPIFSNKATPFKIESSHLVPAMAYPNANDFFEFGDDWEEAQVLAGRSTLRNLARCFLFPADDYYCREFTIDAGFIHNKLILQRHVDDAISQQEEGYGIVFERAVVKGAHPDAHAYNQYLTYPIGEHNLLVRCEVDCLDPKSGRPIGVTTKKRKRMKNGQGFYPIGSANYYQEQWLQMKLSGISTLVIGSRDEGPRDTGTATIFAIEGLSIDEAATRGQLSKADQQKVFDGLNAALLWIKQCFQQALRTKSPASLDKLAQAQIRFTTTGNRKELSFVSVPATAHVDMLSDGIVQGLNASSK